MASIQHDEKETSVQITNCVLHMGGDFAGNLDFEIRFDRDIDIDVVRAQLRLQDAHGRDQVLKIKGFSGGGDHYDITTTWPIDPAAAAIDFIWRDGNVSLGSVPVKEVRPEDFDDSERFETKPTGKGCLSLLLIGPTVFGVVRLCETLLQS